MYTYKRFRTSKSALIIILIALALVAWGILGITGKPLAKKGGDQGKETATFNLTLTYFDVSPEIPSALAFAKGTETVTNEISPGTKWIDVFPSGPNNPTRALYMPFLIPDFTDDGFVGVTHHTHMLVSQDKSDPGVAEVGFSFDALGTDRSIVPYGFWMRGEIIGDWLPTIGKTTVITALSGDYWEIKPSKAKYRSVACEWEGPGLDWELEIERVSPDVEARLDR